MRIPGLARPLVLALLLVSLGGPGLARALAPQKASFTQAATRDDKNRTVYITRTGKKYHAGPCRYLSRSKIPIQLSDAINRGFTACSVCGGG